jgi:hypothetical protein
VAGEITIRQPQVEAHARTKQVVVSLFAMARSITQTICCRTAPWWGEQTLSVYSALNQSGKKKAVGETEGSLRKRKTEAPLCGDIRAEQANQESNFDGALLADFSLPEASIVT